MGQPKKQRRKYDTPKHMFKGREGESDLIRAFGLKNARELWKAKSEVARIRSLARGLLAKSDEKLESDLIGRLKRAGLISGEARLEDVLKITIEDVLDRRLQTQVYKRGLANSVRQARQEIVHGHISVAGKRMNAPGHTTTLTEAESLDFYAGSALTDPEHPARYIPKKVPEAASREVNAENVKPPSERKDAASDAPKAEDTGDGKGSEDVTDKEAPPKDASKDNKE